MIHYLYLITRSDGNKYVGVSNDPHRRLDEHIKGRGNIFLKGEKDLTLSIIDSGEEAYIYTKEHELIEKLKPELNLAKGGCGGNTGHSPKGEDHGAAKITEDQVLIIRSSTETQDALASKYGVTRQTISDIKRGRSWKHVGGLITKNKRTKITEELVREMLELYKAGNGFSKIGKIVGVSSATAMKYCKI